MKIKIPIKMKRYISIDNIEHFEKKIKWVKIEIKYFHMTIYILIILQHPEPEPYICVVCWISSIKLIKKFSPHTILSKKFYITTNVTCDVINQPNETFACLHHKYAHIVPNETRNLLIFLLSFVWMLDAYINT